MKIPLSSCKLESSRIGKYIAASPEVQGRQACLYADDLTDLLSVAQDKSYQHIYEAITLAFYYGMAKAARSRSGNKRAKTP